MEVIVSNVYIFSLPITSDEKLKLLKRLERNLMLSQGDKKADDSSHEPVDEDPQGKKDFIFLLHIF